jgi:hypothetical protein
VPHPPRTATTEASATANATEGVFHLLAPLQFLPVFIEGPLFAERVTRAFRVLQKARHGGNPREMENW